jgi:hypothetical protein
MVEELMPELMELVLSHIDHASLVACQFVCTTWMTMHSTSLHEHLKEGEDHTTHLALKG